MDIKTAKKKSTVNTLEKLLFKEYIKWILINLIEKEWVKEVLDTTWRCGAIHPKTEQKQWLALTFEYFGKGKAYEKGRDANKNISS